MYVTRGMERDHPKGGDRYHASCIRSHLHYLVSCFCHMVSCFIYRNLHLRHIVQHICAIVFQIPFWNNPTTETVTLNAYICLQGREGVEKSFLRYGRTKWMAPNKCCGIFFCTGTAKYTKASLPARKMSLFSSIIITIILSYAIIRIYIILHIYLQVSETEGLAELH